jgi:integrase-like protein
VNQLRQHMLEELQNRNFADTTIRTYLHGVAHFSRYFRRPPDQLGPEAIRKYQAMLFTKLKYSPNTVILRLASLRGEGRKRLGMAHRPSSIRVAMKLASMGPMVPREVKTEWKRSIGCDEFPWDRAKAATTMSRRW